MSTPVILARGLEKAYGPVHAVRGLDFEVAPARCVGLLGPNGAGKTTVMRMIMGLTRPSAGELRVFTTVVVPLLKPIVATLAVFSFLAAWNDFMWPLIVLTDAALHTLPVALAGLSREHVQDNELMMAGSVITVLPVLLLFLALQRQYMEGLLAGSVKG